MVAEDSSKSRLQNDFLEFRQTILSGDVATAITDSASILERSRSKEERDPAIEAMIRMERALHVPNEPSLVGTELRWCADRMNALSPGSASHGICLLNLAAWHRNRGETMMSLATHSGISLSTGHPIEIVGLSRLEVARILVGLNDLDPAMRHFWSAREYLTKSGMSPEALSASLEWLDLALEEVDSKSPRMSVRVTEATPRGKPGNTWVPANPEDIREIVESLIPVLLVDVSGDERKDIGLILDAAELLAEDSWLEIISERISEIQDSSVVAALQS
ncbi:MAG: hypothetical protein CND01_00850 [Marine Group II euryarchaeote MED-G34]|jgi:hypothetical protein|nr:MAG: hypothetical protein CND01_00850 [Marine Group II euryarchaeote MED-G34]|tara:strand:+ start:1687 stop:2517 length:831 start_codon:yes stop_codon:yes gene_type:complete